MTSELGVIVVVRNAVGTIGRALHSVISEISQLEGADVRCTDVLVVDGGSTDGTSDVVTRFAKSNPQVRITAQSGTGLARARNEGIHTVAGDLVAFLDADDEWTPGSLARRIGVLHSTPDALAVVGHMTTRPLPGSEPPDRHRGRLGEPVPGHTPGCLVAHRRAFELIGGFDESLSLAADSEWFVRARTSSERLPLIDDVVLLKTARSDSLSADVATYRRELLDVSRRYIRSRREAT